MKIWISRPPSLTLILLLILFAVSSYAANSVAAWARNFPSRFQESVGSLASSMSAAYAESAHNILRDGDVATKTQRINEHFIPAVASHPDTAAWIRDEYSDDIVRLAASDDVAVSSAASDLLSRFNAATESKPPSDGG